jgi:hypothetical protein
MSFANRLLLWLHIGFVIFAIGPVTVATMSTPRYIRTRNLAVTAYLYRITRIFSAVTLGVLLFGIILANTEHKISRPWVTASMTLFVVAAVLLVLIMRDQHKAIDAMKLETAEPGTAVAVPASAPVPAEPPPGPATTDTAAASTAPAAPGTTGDASGTADAAAAEPGDTGQAAARAAHVAAVERGRIASMGGVVSLIWLVTLVLMVWNP